MASADAWMQQEQERFAKAGGVYSAAQHLAASIETGVERILDEEDDEDADALRELLFTDRSSSGAGSSSSSKGARGGKQTSRHQNKVPAAPTPNTSLDPASMESKEAQIRHLAATGYLCWPHARLCSSTQGVGRSESTIPTSTAGSRSSSSYAADSQSGNATFTANTVSAAITGVPDSTDRRLQALATAAVAMWWRIPQIPVFELSMTITADVVGKFYEFMRVVLLLMQQLQATPPQLRSTILHSPAGTTLLTLLHGMSRNGAAHRYVVETLVEDTPPEAAAAGRRVRGAAAGWHNPVPNGRDLVEMLLLPGLLLAPAPGASPVPSTSRTVVMYCHGELPSRRPVDVATAAQMAAGCQCFHLLC
jgi:hypothetical protein